MSSRSKRSTKAATPAASAAAPALAAAAAASVKGKGRRRKAEEPEEEGAAAASAHVKEEEQSSISEPSSKRARASSPAPRKQATSKASASSSSAAAAASSSSSAATADPLSAQWSSFLRPSLPLPLRLLVDSLFPLLSLRDLVVSLAATSKAGLAEMLRFADHCRKEQERDALLYPIAPRKKSKPSSPLGPLPPPVLGPLRSALCVFHLLRGLYRSRLRWLVQSVICESGTNLDSTEVNDIASKLSWIVSLTVTISSSVIKPHFAFPPRLQHLAVTPMRLTPSGKTCDFAFEYVQMVLEAAAALQHLRAFSLCTKYIPVGWKESVDPKRFSPLAAMTGPIESVTITGALIDCLPLLSSMPSLTEIKCANAAELYSSYETALSKWITEDRPALSRLKELPIGERVIKNADLAHFSSSLTDLRPKGWLTADISWVASCKALRRIRFASVSHLYVYHSAADSVARQNPSVGAVVDTIVQLSSLTDVCVRYKDLTDAHFERMLNALPQLTQLELQSDCITSLAPLSLHAQLPRQMRQLSITLPLVPRDHIAHIMRLTALESLSIAGSFTEPLYARQLSPFLPPYPREPMHWLRSFTPRSDREAVPAPPVDPVARAAEHAAFDARVRAGRVRSAELLNAAQLSGVLTFLDCRDFSRAGRSCRAWRAAACLPSAWSLKSNSAAVSSVNDGDNENDASWMRRPAKISPFCLAGHTRALVLSASSPQMSSAILPHLPLWKHACAFRLLHLNSREWRVGLISQPTPADNPLATLSALARLEALELSWTLWDNTDEITACMTVVGPRLKRARFVGLPAACVASLRNVEQLDLSATRGEPDNELLALHRLRCLWISNERWQTNLGHTIRELSLRHQLRHLIVDLSAAGWPSLMLPAAVSSETFLLMLVAGLAGLTVQLPPEPLLVLAPAAGGAAAAADITPMGLDAEAGDATAPALLDSLRIESPCNFQVALSFVPLMRLPRLRSLHLDLNRCSLEVLSPIDEAAARSAPLPPLECLSLHMFLTGTAMEALARLHTLCELSLISANVLHLPRACITRWIAGIPLLELLSLRNAQFGVGAFADLSQLPRLRCLSLASTKLGAPSEIGSLSAFPALQDLTLENVEGLILQERNWMDEMGKPAEETEVADTEAAGASAAAAAAPVFVSFGFGARGAGGAAPAESRPAAPYFVLLPVLARCGLLRSFRWCPTEDGLQRNAQYTFSRSWIPVSARKTAEWQHRTDRERNRERQTLRRFLQQHDQRRQTDPLPPSLCIHYHANSYHTEPYAALAVLDASAVSAGAKQSAGDDCGDDDAEMQSSSSTAVAASSSSSAAAAASVQLSAAQTLARRDAEEERTEQAEQAKAKIKAEKLASIDPNAPAPKRKTKRRY